MFDPKQNTNTPDSPLNSNSDSNIARGQKSNPPSVSQPVNPSVPNSSSNPPSPGFQPTSKPATNAPETNQVPPTLDPPVPSAPSKLNTNQSKNINGLQNKTIKPDLDKKAELSDSLDKAPVKKELELNKTTEDSAGKKDIKPEPYGEPKPSETSSTSSPPPWMAEAPVKTGDGGSEPPKPSQPSEAGKPASESKLVKKSPFAKIVPFLIGAVVIILLVVLVVKFLLPVLKKGDSGTVSPKDQISLIYWGLWEPTEAIQPIITEYESSHPGIKIQYEQVSYKDYRVRLQSALASKKNDPSTGPDIFRIHASWLPMMKGYLYPISSDILKTDDYFAPIQTDLVVKNQWQAVPLMFDCLSLFYNEDLLRTAGQKVPSTWEELQTAALDLTVYDAGGNIQTAGVALGTANNVDHFSDILALMMLQNNASLSDPTNELASDAMTFYTLFSTRDKVWDSTLPNSTYAFATGKVAMIFAPSWRAFDIKNINPELNFKTAVVPQLPDSKVAWSSYWVEGIAQTSKYKKEAQAFLEYLSSDEILRKLYDSQSKVRLFGEVYPKTALAEELNSDPIVGSFVSQGNDARSWYMSSFTHDDGLNDSIIKYYEDAVNAIVNEGEEVQSVLTTVSSGVNQVLSTYNILE
jgi:multiple sugar transport system substrate-binding protein